MLIMFCMFFSSIFCIFYCGAWVFVEDYSGEGSVFTFVNDTPVEHTVDDICDDCLDRLNNHQETWSPL
jgi:hypothetical protein